MRRAHVVLLGLVGTLLAPTLAAQQVPTQGTRVRVLGVGKQPITGAFVRLAGDTVVLTDAAGVTRALILQPGRRWERSAGMHRRTLQGMGIGLLVGAGAGALVAAAYQKDAEPDCGSVGCWPLDSRGFYATMGAGVLGVAGMVIGGLVGSRRRERWYRVDTRAPRVVLLPTGSRSAALAATLSFR